MTIAMRSMVEEMTTFAVVARTGSFTQAAKELSKSKTYVSLQVSRLEEAIGLQLMFRTTRRLELTQAGLAYVDYCHQLLDTVDEAERALDVLKGSMQGVISLSVPVSFGQVFMTEIISEFQLTYPDVQVQLELHNSVKDLKLENLDMAVRMTSVLDEDLVAIKIGSLDMHIYGAPAYLALFDPIISPDQLSQHTGILHSSVDKQRSWPVLVDGAIIPVNLSWKMAVNHYPLIRDSAVEGKGLARLPRYLVKQDLAKKRLCEVLSGFSLVPEPIYLVYQYQGVLPLKTRVFIDFIKAWFEQNRSE